MSTFSRAKSLLRPNTQLMDPVTGAMTTTPWVASTDDGIYIGPGPGSEVWLYWLMPTAPLVWEDPATQLQIGAPLHELLNDLGQTSRRPLGNMKMFSSNRQIHLLGVRWHEIPEPPATSTAAHAAYLREVFWFAGTRKACFVGVQLRATHRHVDDKSAISQIARMVASTVSDDLPDLRHYRTDIELVTSVLARHECRRTTADERRYLESWYNLGRGTDAVMVEEPDGRSITTESWGGIEMASVVHFRRLEMTSPNDKWLTDAFSHPDPAIVVSIRGELEPPEVTRGRFRSSQRKFRAQYDEQQKTGDLERAEDSELFHASKTFENYYAGDAEPWLTNCSIITARQAGRSDETYIDYLRSAHGVEIKLLEQRQMLGLIETLPCSPRRLGSTRPYVQELSLGMVAYSGFTGFSTVGDPNGLYLGLALPDMTPVYLDTRAAADGDKAPGMIIAGVPGSGKTFTLQSLCYQAALNGTSAILINPKAADSLKPFARAAGGEVVSMAALENEGGALDPFRYAETPEDAAEIATAHILSVLIEFTEQQEVELSSGLREGARRGARCVGQALASVADQEVIERVRKMAEGSSLFALGISWVPREPLGIGQNSKLTLIEFDRTLSLPDSSASPRDYEWEERFAVAAMRLVTRASLEILLRNRGGVLAVDEAWTFLSSSDGRKALDRLGREGRSQGILPIFATQKVTDLVKEGVDMETYVSRVLALKMTDPKEAAEAIRLVGLEATRDRIDWLARAGHIRKTPDNEGRGALGMFLDVNGRRCAVMAGPIPASLELTFSTNRIDRELRDQQTAQLEDLT
jgi:hypothetical protein